MGSFLRGLGLGVVVTAFLLIGFAYLFRGVLPVILGTPTPSIPKDVAAEATTSTKEAREKILKELPFSNKLDFEFAERGFVATREDLKIKDEAGRLVFDLASYDFLKGEAPESANPSLWRQAQLITKHGLFKVGERIYQVRGFDVSTVSFIETDKGYIVVDPLTTVEVARAALELVRKHVGDKPVVAVIYSHSHADHFGGVAGVASEEDVKAGRIKVIAPEGFMEHSVSENVIAGPAMTRRARFQFGGTLPRGPEGEMTSGLGPGISTGTVSLIAPTDIISKTGQEMTIDGVTLTFQVTPGTEAPAEMNFYLPQMRALFMAENANATMHNLLPARGALVRDAKGWADYLTQAIRLYGDKSDVMFAAHGVPRFGTGVINDFLAKHRDAYKYLHDQTIRLMNNGLTGVEIAEQLQLPDVLAREWYNRGYYGTMSHNSKAVYQRYMGWYDANPASLNALPPVAAGTHYVEALGGADAVIAKAQAAIDGGEYRWAAMLLNHVVFADAENTKARNMLADVYTQLGYRAEAGTWRNIYLTGAQELRHGVVDWPTQRLSLALIRATPTTMMLDFAAVRLNPERAKDVKLKLNIVLSDLNETHLITIENSVLIHEAGVRDDKADATVTMKRSDMLETLLAGVPVGVKTTTGAIKAEGRSGAYGELVGLIDPVNPNFPIVTP
ncbi:MAG: MBL fold metallo-hydrolase [Alphaproteobacteria bacterium]|nr:MBL fold metallo-hydrolase [Alphaproteobacteria bacterium]